MPSRRSFLAGLFSSTAVPSVGWADVGNPVALSAAMAQDGQHRLVGLTAVGEVAFAVPLPARGHAAAAHPFLAEAVAIARRPGVFAKVIDCASGLVLQTLRAPSGRHFYGHGAFSADGQMLFTTENEISSGAGRIGVWDRSLGFRRIDEFSTAGIGPHEILRLPNGQLAVANGGIRTHPSTGRQKLNLDSMRPSLAIFDVDGTLRAHADVAEDMRMNSLRHIAAAPDGTVVCGFQWQGDPFDAPPLVALYRDGVMRTAEMDAASLFGLDGYIGSVAAFGQNYAASSPRGARAFCFDPDGRQIGSYRATDICGLCAVSDGTCLANDGLGHVYRLSETGLRQIATHPLAFDNHLVALA